MRCHKIQDLIKTDYLDGLLEESQVIRIKEHISGCKACRSLEESLLAQQAAFKNAGCKPAPEAIWENVRKTILTEQLKDEPKSAFEYLRSFLFPGRAVFTLASAATAIILVTFLTGAFIMHKPAAREKSETIAEFNLDQPADLLYSLGTNIEEVFL